MTHLLLALALVIGTVWPAVAQVPIPGTNVFTGANGSATNPSRTYLGDRDLGTYRIGENNEGNTAGGALRWDWNTSRMKLSSGYTLDFNTTSISETDIAKIDGITNGTVAASKAVVVDANLDIGTFRHVTLNGNLVSGSTTLSETDLAKIDGITNGTVTASKALVVDANKDLSSLRHLAWSGVLRGNGSTNAVALSGDVIARRAANEGAYYFGDNDAAYLYYDGDYSFGNTGDSANLTVPGHIIAAGGHVWAYQGLYLNESGGASLGLIYNIADGKFRFTNAAGTSGVTLSTVSDGDGVLTLRTRTDGAFGAFNALFYKEQGGGFQGSTLTGTLVTNDAQALADTDIIPLGTAAVQGLLVVVNASDGWQCLFSLTGGLATVELLDPATECSTVAGTGTSTNVYWDAGDARYELQNNQGGSKNYRLIRLGQ